MDLPDESLEASSCKRQHLASAPVLRRLAPILKFIDAILGNF